MKPIKAFEFPTGIQPIAVLIPGLALVPQRGLNVGLGVIPVAGVLVGPLGVDVGGCGVGVGRLGSN